jgi:hypothetical protein
LGLDEEAGDEGAVGVLEVLFDELHEDWTAC